MPKFEQPVLESGGRPITSATHHPSYPLRQILAAAAIKCAVLNRTTGLGTPHMVKVL